MSFEVLCDPYFPADEAAAIDQVSRQLGKTPEDLIREAVKFFVGECVPTHGTSSDDEDCA